MVGDGVVSACLPSRSGIPAGEDFFRFGLGVDKDRRVDESPPQGKGHQPRARDRAVRLTGFTLTPAFTLARTRHPPSGTSSAVPARAPRSPNRGPGWLPNRADPCPEHDHVAGIPDILDDQNVGPGETRPLQALQ